MKMADETTSDCRCHNEALYIVMTFAVLVGVACVVLIWWIIKLKRRQNGYAPVHGNEDEVHMYKNICDEERKGKRNALQKVETFKVLLDEEQREVRKLKAMYEEEKMAKEDALQRLSKIMSDRLTDGNPNIANLSDMKRPTKLAEELSEVYDDEWTGAFESLQTVDKKEDQEKIHFLLEVLETTFGWCKLQAYQQLQKLETLLLRPGETEALTTVDVNVSKDIMKTFKDSRKMSAEKTAAYISEKILTEVRKQFRESEWIKALMLEPMEAYCRKCAELAWFLVVQDPPMDMKFSDVKAEDMKAYTQSGNKVDFVVWPPLYLQENGNLMNKGIAQFRMK